MQSGLARTKLWVLDYDPEAARVVEPLMGWTASSDMNAQVRLTFESSEDAIAYAERNNIAYEVCEPHARAPKPKAYADNFRFGRHAPWTH